MDFLRDNIGWIRDIVILLSTGVLTVVAVFTFLRAKETFLQPIRSEVIKKQSELLSRLLDRVRSNRIDDELDYTNLVRINVYYTLKWYGFVMKDQEKAEKWADGQLGGLLAIPKGDTVTSLEVISTFSSAQPDDASAFERRRKDDYEGAKAGKIEIQEIRLTKKHIDYMRSLSDFIDSPFLPQKMQVLLVKINADIHKNLVGAMKASLEEFCRDLFQKHPELGGGWDGRFHPDGVYNDFNHKRISHRADVAALTTEIRRYLKIDSMP